MTDLHVERTPEQATATLLGVCKELAEPEDSVSSARLAQLTVTELDELRRAVTASAMATDNASVSERCTRMGGLVVAELYRRTYEQAAIDAKAAVIAAEERRRACAPR